MRHITHELATGHPHVPYTNPTGAYRFTEASHGMPVCKPLGEHSMQKCMCAPRIATLAASLASTEPSAKRSTPECCHAAERGALGRDSWCHPCICDTQYTIVAKWQAKEQAAQHAAAALRWRGTGAQAAGGADR